MRDWNPTSRRRELFWRWVKVGNDQECWPWQLPLDAKGYGHCTVDGWRTTAHRVSYALAKGAFDPALNILHSCDYRACCNPAHLRPGTQAENLAEMRLKGRAGDSRVFGERHGRAVLSDAEVREMRAARASGATHAALSERFKISIAQTGRILRGESRVVT